VPRAELPRATALNALVMTAAGTVGPALAGLTAATLGLTVNFALNALGFAVVIACLASVRTDAPPAPGAGRQPLLRSVGAGLAVVGGHAGLRSVVTGYGLLLLLGPSPSVVLPLYAAQVLHVGGAELGALRAGGEARRGPAWVRAGPGRRRVPPEACVTATGAAAGWPGPCEAPAPRLYQPREPRRAAFAPPPPPPCSRGAHF